MNKRNKTIFTGLLAGAILGGAFAWVASSGYEDAEESESPLAALGPADYFQLGISILTLARQFGSMLKRSA